MAHVVFDWDGTLFDSVRAMAAADNLIAERFGWKPVDFDDYQANSTREWRRYYDALRAANGRPALTDEEIDALVEAWHEAHDALVEGQSLFDGARELLHDLREAGYTLSICSMHRHRELLARVQAFGLDHLFSRVDGLLGADRGETKLEHLRSHVEKLRADGMIAEGVDVTMVGDSIDDASAAAALGFRVVLTTTGECSADRLAATGWPVVETVRDCLQHLGLPDADGEMPL